MATMRKTTGTCTTCNREFAKAAMTKHVAACPALSLDGETPLHIVVEGNPAPLFWMHLAVKRDAKLVDLDRFLRAVWLECCGHLSMFRIGGISYFSSEGNMSGRKMAVAVEKVLRPGIKLDYEYDFGSTTALKLHIVGTCGGGPGNAPVELLARNNPPALACGCGKPATEICTECACEGEGWLCDSCVDSHACGEESLLPVVNSPRVGVCGYTG